MNVKTMKRFVTVFGQTSNIQLIKDVGMLPYNLGKKGYFDAIIAAVKKQDEYPALDNEVKGLKVHFFTKYFNSVWFSELVYVVKNAKKIDILNLYHLNLRSCLQIFAYKLFNKEGYVYLKTDISNQFLRGKEAYNFLKRRIYVKTLSKCNLVTAESRALSYALTEYGNREVKYLPNGFLVREAPELSKKENIILTVGRLGTVQKNTELLLDAFVKADLKGWKLRLAGSVTDEFKNRLERTVESNPELAERIEIIGFVSDSDRLAKLYAEAKIFVLPSRWESFGLVILEALAQGDFVILSDSVSPAPDIIKSDLIGRIFKNEDNEDLCNILKEVVKEDSLFVDKVIEARKAYTVEKFSWDAICDKLADMISSENEGD